MAPSSGQTLFRPQQVVGPTTAPEAVCRRNGATRRYGPRSTSSRHACRSRHGTQLWANIIPPATSCGPYGGALFGILGATGVSPRRCFPMPRAHVARPPRPCLHGPFGFAQDFQLQALATKSFRPQQVAGPTTKGKHATSHAIGRGGKQSQDQLYPLTAPQQLRWGSSNPAEGSHLSAIGHTTMSPPSPRRMATRVVLPTGFGTAIQLPLFEPGMATYTRYRDRTNPSAESPAHILATYTSLAPIDTVSAVDRPWSIRTTVHGWEVSLDTSRNTTTDGDRPNVTTAMTIGPRMRHFPASANRPMDRLTPPHPTTRR